MEAKRTDSSAIINTQGLSKTYRSGRGSAYVVALKPLDLRVHRNSICGILGPNGAGKTTMIKLLLGLIQPTGGSASVFGLDIQHDSVAVRDRIGYLPQDPRFYENMTARQILHYTAGFSFEGPTIEIERRVAETLELVGLAGKARRPSRDFLGESASAWVSPKPRSTIPTCSSWMSPQPPSIRWVAGMYWK